MMADSSDESESQRLYLKGCHFMYQGDLERARRYLRKSARLEPHHKTLQILGECLQKMGRLSEAVVPLAAAVSLNPHPRSAALLAQTFFAISDFVNARKYAEITLVRMPHYRRIKDLLDLIKRAELDQLNQTPPIELD